MDYSKFKTPLINNKEIQKIAEKVRESFWKGEVPIDIEKVLEKYFKIQVIPLKNANRTLCFESFITSNWESIFVDQDQYMDDIGYRRVRFSLAHELGHLILHKKLYESLNINDIEDYYKFCDKVPGDQYSFLETQANKFAGYLLVPREELEKKKQEVLKDKMKLIVGTPFEGHPEMIEDYIVDDLADIFDVSSKTMEICLGY